MVEFYDPVTKTTLSYYISKKLIKKWDKLKDGRLQLKDEDRVYIVDGRERSGKSVFTFQQAKYIDPTFNIDRVCFSPDEFLQQIKYAPEGAVIVFDEAFRGLSSKASQSKVNKKIVEAMMEMGQRNLVVFIVLPTIFLLELYAAVLRTNALFHVYKDRKNRRAFKIYNYNKKSWLYNYGKKRGFSYAMPKVRPADRFYNKYSINEDEYRLKKLNSLHKIEASLTPPEVVPRWKIQRDFLLKQLLVYAKTKKKLMEIMKDCEYPVSYDQIKDILNTNYQKIEK